MRLSRLWDNQSLGILPVEAGQPEAMAAFEQRGRRHAMRLSIKIVVSGILLICMMWGIISYAIHQETQSALERARAQGQNLTAAFAAEVTRMLDTIVVAMDAITERVRIDLVDGVSAAEERRLTDDINAIVRPVVRAAILTADGRMVYSTLPQGATAAILSSRREFTAHRNADAPSLLIGDPIVGIPGQPPMLPVTRRIEAQDGSLLGVLLFSLTPLHLTRLHQSIDLGRRGTLSLIGLDGLIRARFTADDPTGNQGVGTSVLDGPFRSDMPLGAVISYARVSAVDGVTRLFVARRMTDYDMFVSIGIDQDDILADARRLQMLTLVVGAAITLLIGFLTLLLVREIWRRTMREVDLAREHGRLEEAHNQILRDRERLAITNRELIATADRADAANQAKSQFLANMSHELRTPLHAIIGFSELIKEQAPRVGAGSRIADYATDILASGRHLLELINTVLDLSKVEAGTAMLTESVVPIADVINASLIAIRSQASTRRITIGVTMPEDPPVVEVDLTKMRQVLINLLSNAVKFTREGGSVTITVARDARTGVTIAVADTGIGMTEEELVIAMEPFGQVDSTLSRQADGTGLGLPLAQRLIELHGGELKLRSVKGEGTTVEVTIPANRVRQGRLPAAITASGRTAPPVTPPSPT